jgi:hypothetical protein
MSKKILIPIIVLMLAVMSCTINLPNNDTGKDVEEEETVEEVDTEEVETEEVETEEVETEEPVTTVSDTPAPTLAVPTVVIPTVAPTTGYFSDDFDGDLSSWVPYVIAGNPDMTYVTPVGHRLVFELPRLTETYAYVANTAAEFEDVYVEANFESKTNTPNGISVLCRISDLGWYELRVYTSGPEVGRFSLYRFDFDLRSQKKNPYVNLLGGYSTLTSVDLLNGQRVNTIGLLCQGDSIVPYINGVQQNGSDRKPLKVVDSNWMPGNVGIGAMSFSGEVVKVEFDWVETSEP